MMECYQFCDHPSSNSSIWFPEYIKLTNNQSVIRVQPNRKLTD